MEFVVEPENKGTLIATPSYLLFVNQFYRSGLSSLTFLNDVVRTVYEGLNFIPFHPFYEKFNDQVHHLIASGTTQKMLTENTNIWGKVSITEEAVEPQVLTLEHLSAGFFVCGIVLTSSFFVFLVEVSSQALKKLMNCFSMQ